MARVAVLHNTLDLHGGADAVCLYVCEALQDHHDVTLMTLSRSSLGELNRLFDTRVAVDVERPFGTRPVGRLLDSLAARLGPQLAFRSVLLARAFGERADTFDAAVSTANEFALSVPSVQYIHYPQFNRRHAASTAADASRLDAVWSRCAGLDSRTLPTDATLLSNSEWTAGVVEDIYDRRPAVLFPPVDPFSEVCPWDDRDDGIVVVGRLAPDKQPLRAVEILDGLRARGHDVHLHIVGTAPRAYRDYVRRLESAAADRPSVHLECDASRSRIEQLLTTHKYGLNTKPDEHFGMAVAECVAAGMLVFAPDSGGQRDILDYNPDRLYETVEEAIELIDTAIEANVTPSLPRDRYSSDRFKRAIRHHVNIALNC